MAQKIKGASLAKEALEFIADIYEVESKCRHLSCQRRYYYRKKHLKNKYAFFKRWLVSTQKSVFPKTPVFLAIQYALNHWRALQNVLASGLLEVDNNLSERAIKPVVIGRKNYLFAGSLEGGKRSAILYSLIESAKQNTLNPFEYLRDILSKISSTPCEQLWPLLPYHWKPS